MAYPDLVEQLISQFSQFPGVGRRSAERMVFWLLQKPRENALQLAEGIMKLKDRLRFCKICQNLTENENCRLCTDPHRDQKILCVVEDHKHLLAIERTGTFKGLYHVLLGAISPSEGRGPQDLLLDKLTQRIKEKGILEVVIATDPDTEGEMTAIHISNVLKAIGVKVSRIGLGIPVGSSVEYADLSTLTMSLASRREI